MPKQPFKQMILSDAEKTAYRLAARKVADLGRSGVIKALSAQGGDRAAAMAIMLDTEPGKGLVSMLLGAAVTFAPQLQGDARVERIAEELRVNGITLFGDSLVDAASDLITPAMGGILANLPAPSSQATEEEEEEEETSLDRRERA